MSPSILVGPAHLGFNGFDGVVPDGLVPAHSSGPSDDPNRRPIGARPDPNGRRVAEPEVSGGERR